MSDAERVRSILDDAARTLDNGRPLLAADLWAIHDELIAMARDVDGCLHYDRPPRYKFKGELVCDRCSVVFGYWR